MEKQKDGETKMDLREKLHIEKKILDWIVENRYQLFLLILIYGFLKLFSMLPYVNLLVDNQVIVFIVSITAFFILNIGIKRPLFVGILLFIPALIFELVGEPEVAEIIGNFIFGIFFVTAIAHIVKYKHSIDQK